VVGIAFEFADILRGRAFACTQLGIKVSFRKLLDTLIETQREKVPPLVVSFRFGGAVIEIEDVSGIASSYFR
jgi:hypothetical protein